MNVNGITTNGYDNAAYTDTAVKNSTNKDSKTSTASFSCRTYRQDEVPCLGYVFKAGKDLRFQRKYDKGSRKR